MLQLWRQAAAWLGDGERLVLVTIVKSAGSTPRRAGARMLVGAEVCQGTVGGGAVEHAAQTFARELLRKEQGAYRSYDLSQKDAAGLGMVCGGSVALLYQYLPANEESAAFFGALAELSPGRKGGLLTAWAGEEQAMLLLQEEGAPVASWGGLGEQELPELSSLEEKACWERDGVLYFYETLFQGGRVYLFGGGHISRELVPLLHHVFFSCTVVDSSKEFANRAHFPQADQVRALEFDTALSALEVGEADYIVILTRGHLHDYAVLAQALRTPARYIGMVGSRGKIALTYSKLQAQHGFTQADLDRVHAPIGLPIGGDTPQEIAVSIAAQLIAVRAGKMS